MQHAAAAAQHASAAAQNEALAAKRAADTAVAAAAKDEADAARAREVAEFQASLRDSTELIREREQVGLLETRLVAMEARALAAEARAEAASRTARSLHQRPGRGTDGQDASTDPEPARARQDAATDAEAAVGQLEASTQSEVSARQDAATEAAAVQQEAATQSESVLTAEAATNVAEEEASEEVVGDRGRSWEIVEEASEEVVPAVRAVPASPKVAVELAAAEAEAEAEAAAALASSAPLAKAISNKLRLSQLREAALEEQVAALQEALEIAREKLRRTEAIGGVEGAVGGTVEGEEGAEEAGEPSAPQVQSAINAALLLTEQGTSASLRAELQAVRAAAASSSAAPEVRQQRSFEALGEDVPGAALETVAEEAPAMASETLVPAASPPEAVVPAAEAAAVVPAAEAAVVPAAEAAPPLVRSEAAAIDAALLLAEEQTSGSLRSQLQAVRAALEQVRAAARQQEVELRSEVAAAKEQEAAAVEAVAKTAEAAAAAVEEAKAEAAEALAEKEERAATEAALEKVRGKRPTPPQPGEGGLGPMAALTRQVEAAAERERKLEAEIARLTSQSLRKPAAKINLAERQAGFQVAKSLRETPSHRASPASLIRSPTDLSPLSDRSPTDLRPTFRISDRSPTDLALAAQEGAGSHRHDASAPSGTLRYPPLPARLAPQCHRPRTGATADALRSPDADECTGSPRSGGRAAGVAAHGRGRDGSVHCPEHSVQGGPRRVWCRRCGRRFLHRQLVGRTF